MGMYKYDVNQVYRSKREVESSHKDIIPAGILLQVVKYEGSTIYLKKEKKLESFDFIIFADSLLDENNFERIF